MGNSDLPKDKRVVGWRWVFAAKYKSDGTIKRYKARLVVQVLKTFCIDYDEIFTPVAKTNSIRVLWSLAANLDWELYQMDIKSLFLNGELDEEISLKILLVFAEEKKKGKCVSQKSLFNAWSNPRARSKQFLLPWKSSDTSTNKLIILCPSNIQRMERSQFWLSV